MKKITIEDFKKGIEWASKNPDGCYFFKVGKTEDGKDIALVLGHVEGYEEGEKYQTKSGDTIFTLCGKVAVNIDDLQCDYNYDWYMPWDENGDVFDSETAINDEELDYLYFMGEIKDVVSMLKSKKLTVN